MAKGNNGNLLQHFVECQAASLLAEGMHEKRLHVVLTHGMAPCECCEERRPGNPRGLREWLAHLEKNEADARYPVLSAYKKLKASEDRYPNSAELIAAVLADRSRLSGVVCEVEESKVEALEQAWRGHDLTVHGKSWRSAELCAPADLSAPWLFSMDPYTYRERPTSEAKDDGRLYDVDLCCLIPVFSGYLQSDQPGTVCLFCYSLRPRCQRRFSAAMSRLMPKLPCNAVQHKVCTPAHGRREHVGIIISADAELPAKIAKAWDEFPLCPGKQDAGWTDAGGSEEGR